MFRWLRRFTHQDLATAAWFVVELPFNPVLESITFLPTGQGTTGDISNDNPDGQGGTPEFGGGYRFFPDAASYETRTQSRNIVRMRAAVTNARAGVPVYFRSFDVDDPSPDATIDPNGNAGKDNRGIAAGVNLDAPFPAPAGQGYQGRLRPVGGNFAGEGATVMVLTDEQGRAEVEMATSFNPGDNFRVVASLNQQEVQNLNDTTSVPTVGPIANFQGKATEQLSLWRRFHIEQDRMAAIPWGTVSGNITAVGAPDSDRLVVVTTTLNLAANQFLGGSLRSANSAEPNVPDRRYHIIRHGSGPISTVTIRVPEEMPLPSHGAVSLTQGDFQVGIITETFAEPAVGLYSLKADPNLNFAEENEYDGGILHANGVNYHIIGNSDGPNSGVKIVGNAAPPPGATVTLYQDDFSSTGDRLGTRQFGRITAVDEPAGDQTVVRTNMTLTANRFAGGILRVAAGRAYSIVSNSGGPSATVTLMGAVTPPQDDIGLFVNLGSAVPTTLTGITSDANLYEMLQPTTFRSQNRYADAYLQPELNALNQFDSNNVTPVSHVTGFSTAEFREFADPFRGTSPGSVARPDDYETNVFWSVYVLTGFEWEFSVDADPEDEDANFGITDGTKRQISMVFLETLRDEVALHAGLRYTEAEVRARTSVHEIGHQFGIAVVPGEHRDDTPNIMHSDALSVPLAQFFFHPADIVALRESITSPGR